MTTQLVDSVKMSREYGLLGDYKTALVYFDGIERQIDQHVKTLQGPDDRTWKEVRDKLETEKDLVASLSFLPNNPR